MKVLHVSCSGVFGGIETVLSALGRYRSRVPELEFEFTVCSRGRLSTELEEQGATVHDLGVTRPGRPGSVFRARRRLRELVSRGRYDVAVCHGPRSMVILGPVLRAAGVPLVMWVHGFKPTGHWLRRLLKRVPPDFAVCCSRYAQSEFRSMFPGVDSTVVYAPVGETPTVDPDTREAARRERGVSRGTRVIVLAGRMVPLKGQGVLVDALAGLETRTPWACWIIGGAQTAREKRFFHGLEKRIGRHGLEDRVFLLGNRTDVPHLLACGDLYCQPNLRGEWFGISFVEALWAGLPVLTSKIGGALEIVDNTCGLLLPAGDVSALTRALKGALEDEPGSLYTRNGCRDRARRLCDPPGRMAELSSALSRFVGGEAPALSRKGAGPPGTRRL